MCACVLKLNKIKLNVYKIRLMPAAARQQRSGGAEPGAAAGAETEAEKVEANRNSSGPFILLLCR